MLEMNSGWNKDRREQWKCITAVRVNSLHVLCWEWTEIVLQNHNVPKIYMWTPEDASTRWSQRQADTFKQQAMKLISERRRNVRRTFSFFCIVLNWVIFFFFITSQTFLWNISSLHLNSISEKRMFMFQNSKNIFFIFILFSFFFLHVKLSENKFQKENYIFILCYIWNRNIFSLTMTFSSRRIFSSEIKIKWIFIYPCETKSKQRDKRQTFLKNIFSLHLTQKMSHNKKKLSVKTIEKKLLFFIFPGQFFLSCLTPQSITPLFL